MEFATSKAMRFTVLHVENWRNFGRINVELQRRSFVVGPNASGKSNFLDVFRFLRDLFLWAAGLSRPCNLEEACQAYDH